MTDIFLSYNREDQARAKLFAEAFEAAGFNVWWDVGLRTGEAYDEATETALRASKAVVVLWSKKSVASRWVRAEATLAHRNKTLVPCMIEQCERPIMFELTQTAELAHWKGDGSDQAWIAFLADVRRLVESGAPDTHSTRAGPSASAPGSLATMRQRYPHMSALALLIVLFVTIAFAAVVLRQQSQVAATPQRLAVLRFEAVGDTPTYFAEGLADEVITQAALISGLEVNARSSSFGLSEISPGAAANELGATIVLTGSVERLPNMLRVRTELVSARDGRLIWRESFESPLNEALFLQRTIALRIAAAARLRLDASQTRNVDPAAFDLYLRAREGYERGWADNDGEIENRPAALLRRAVGLDPQFAEAWALLSAVELRDWAAADPGADPSDEAIAEALRPTLEAADRALAIDQQLVRPYETRAVALAASGRWLEAQEADDEADRRGGYGRLPEFTGRFREMRARAQRVVELDPLNGRARYFLGLACAALGDAACARAASARYFEMNPNDPGAFFNLFYDTVEQGDVATARQMLVEHPELVRQLESITPFLPQYMNFKLGDGPPPSIEQIMEEAGLVTDAVAWLLNLGQWRAAIPYISTWPLNRLNFVLLEPDSAPLRQTPEFWATMERLGLLQYWRDSGRWPDFCANESVCAAFGGPRPE